MTSTTHEKPREWEVFDNGEEPCLAYATVSFAIEDLGNRYEETISVIEKSAYDKAVAALKRYPCVCQTTLPEVKEVHAGLECFRCKNLRELGEV